MERKKISWQEIVGMVLLLALCIPLFLPVMEISGDAYISAAVKVNEHAKEQDEKKAKEAGVPDMLKTYDKDTKERREKEKEYDKEIEKNKDSISGFGLAKWGLTVKEHDELKLDGITLQKEKAGDSSKEKDTEKKQEDGSSEDGEETEDSGNAVDGGSSEDKGGNGDSKGKKDEEGTGNGADSKDGEDAGDSEDSKDEEDDNDSEGKKDSESSKEKKIEDSGVAGVFKFMGVLLLLPAVLGIIGCVTAFIRRKGYGVWLIVSGTASAGAYLLIQYVLPGMIWDKSADYIEKFSLIDKGVLDMEDMGEYAISTMMHEFSSIGMLTGLILGCLLAVAGVLFMTVFKPAEQQEDDDWDFGLPPVGGGVPPVNDMHGAGANMYAAGGNGDTYPGDGSGGMYAPGSNDGMPYAPYGQEGDFGSQNGGWDNQEAASGMEQMVTEAWQEEYVQMPQAPQVGNLPKGVLLGVAGQYRGAVVEVNPGEEVILGRDPKYCKLVFDYAKVSRKHCGIIFDASSGMYRVIDYSSNGTLLSNGQEAMAGSYITVPPGTVVYLANKHEGVELCEPAQYNSYGR